MANKDYSNVFIFPEIYPHLLYFTHKVDKEITRTVASKTYTSTGCGVCDI